MFSRVEESLWFLNSLYYFSMNFFGFRRNWTSNVFLLFCYVVWLKEIKKMINTEFIPHTTRGR